MSYRRIACLSTEAVEVLYAVGAADRVAGISGYTVYPPEARREKPKISAFSTAHIDRILAVQPDLAIAFSDLQADIARALVQAGVEVHVFNQRDVAGILRMVRTLAALVDASEAGARLAADLQARLDAARAAAMQLPRRPRVYFEEWPDPLICGIGWVSELIEIAGGEDVFAEQARQPGARARTVADPGEVVRRAPEIIVASWCGRKVPLESIVRRAGWERLPAVRDGEVHEIKSADILAPGPGAIARGLVRLEALIASWARRRSH